jgi:hypothetical protein
LTDRLLVSFCNQPRGDVLLAVADARTRRAEPVSTPDLEHVAGATGLALSQDGETLYVALQDVGEPARRWLRSGIAALAPDGLGVLYSHRLERVIDIHSVAVTGEEELVVVSTGTDELVRVRTGAGGVEEQPVWRARRALTRRDRRHLNSVCAHDGTLLVSGFGAQSGKGWTTATDGFIVDVRAQRTLASGIRHPHSLVAIEDSIAYCESLAEGVATFGGLRVDGLPGYTRGLYVDEDSIYVGTSKRRHLEGTGDPGVCGVTKLGRHTLAVEWTLDLGDLADEVYDVIPLPGG